MCLKWQRKCKGHNCTFCKNIHVESWSPVACSPIFHLTLDNGSTFPLPTLFNSCFLCCFIISCVAPIYPSLSPSTLFIYSLSPRISFSLLLCFPVITITICASTNAQNRLLMTQMNATMPKCKRKSTKAHLRSSMAVSRLSIVSKTTWSTCIKEWPSLSRNSKYSTNLMSSLVPQHTTPFNWP